MKLSTIKLDCIVDGKRFTQLGVVNIEAEATFRSETERKDVTVFKGVELVASVLLKHQDVKCASFCKLFVRHDMRRQGIASALIAMCEEMAKEVGCKTIGCTVSASNDDAIDCYKKAGYIFAWEFSDGDLVMVKTLQ